MWRDLSNHRDIYAYVILEIACFFLSSLVMDPTAIPVMSFLAGKLGQS